MNERNENDSLLNGIPAGVLKFSMEQNQKFKVLSFNRHMCNILDCDEETMRTLCFEQLRKFFLDEDLVMIKNKFTDENLKEHIVHRVITGSKEEKWVLSKFRKEENNAGIYYAVLVDITSNTEVMNDEYEHTWHNALLRYIFDDIGKSNNIENDMNALLNHICYLFQVNLASVVALRPDGKMLSMFTSTMNIPALEKEKFEAMDLTMLKHVYDYCDSDGILAVDDLYHLRSGSPLKALVTQTNAKAVLQCAFFEDGQYKGCIYLEDRFQYRAWSKYQKKTLVTISRMIAFYLLKIKMSDEIDEKIKNLQNFDLLTGLPTLRQFVKRAEEFRKKSSEERYAIVMADIDKFNEINELFGYEFGDEVLKDLSILLHSRMGYHHIYGRVNSDIFIGFIPYKGKEVLEESLIIFNEKFHNMEKQRNINCNLTLKFGVYIISPDDKIMRALDYANTARKSVKNSGTLNCCFFNEQMKAQKKKEREMTSCMEDALAKGEFLVYLQPKIELKENTIAGAEALVRWNKDGKQMIPPDEFIPLFEKNGFIIQLDFYVYEQVCKTLQRWIREGKQIIPVSVNVSRIHLYDGNFLERVISLVDQYAIPRDVLEFELTESIFLDNSKDALFIMRGLRELGFKVSIDDFGSGYSSLSILKDITSDVLKLDKEFFGRGEMKQEDKIIVSNIIHMAKQLNMKVLSEGVETDNQSSFLKEMSCDMAQGYLYSKPIPVGEFENKYFGND